MAAKTSKSASKSDNVKSVKSASKKATDCTYGESKDCGCGGSKGRK